MSEVVLSNPFKAKDIAAKSGFAEVAKDTTWQIKEFGFWVLVKPKGKDTQYFFTKPETNDSNNHITLTLKVPVGFIVAAFCHTHPKSDNVGDFGGDDLSHFKEARKKNPTIVFYLMNQTGQIRLAESEKDFPKGRAIP